MGRGEGPGAGPRRSYDWFPSPFFVQYVLQPASPTTWIGLFLLTYLGAGLLMIPLWMVVAQKIGKLQTLILNSVIGITGSTLFFFAGEGELRFAGAIYFLTGMVSMAGSFLVPAMAADVIDYDELRTGRRREAQYTAFWALIPKLVAIPGSSIPLAILAAVGYVPNQPQTADVLFWIRFMYSLFPVAFYVTSVIVVSRYPISEKLHALIREGLDNHKRGDIAIDPITQSRIAPFGQHPESDELGWFLDYFSPNELRQAQTRGASTVFTRVVGVMLAWLVVCGGASTVAALGFQNPDSDPALRVVLAVVVAGVAFTAFVFHLLRLGPARRLAKTAFDTEAVTAHLSAQH